MNGTDECTVSWETGAIGAEVSGVDLGAAHGPDFYAHLRRLLAERGVIFFRDQDITPAQHAAFAAHFGRYTVGKHVDRVAGFEEITEISKAEDELDNIGGGWHADQTFFEAPPWGTILVARELPAHGGDTLFASMAAAYDALSDGLKRTLQGMRAVHGNARLLAASKRLKNISTPSPEVVHPVVIRHPVTGRKSLFVNAAYTLRFDGWSERESAPLLDFLALHGQRPEFQCRFRWRPGSIAFWDNLQVWHYAANDYQGQRRLMHRIAIAGEGLLAA